MKDQQLSSDGLTREQFMPLWRDAMWAATSVADRARLVLELGRLEVRDNRLAAPLAVAFVPELDTPFVMLSLAEAPTAELDPARRAVLRDRLAEMGASELYMGLTVVAGEQAGVPSYLLAAWAETVGGEKECWLQPFRWRAGALEWAPAMRAPDASATVFDRQLSGLLALRH